MDANYKRALETCLAEWEANRKRDEIAWRRAEAKQRHAQRQLKALGIDAADLAALAKHLGV